MGRIYGKTKYSDGEYTYKSVTLEKVLAEQIRAIEGVVKYEPFKIKYVVPESHHTYTPDYLLLNGLLIEAKGELTAANRKKHILVRDQHPEYEIRFVFQNARNKISSKSKTTYADWSEKNGFKWAHKTIPLEWFK